MQGESLAAMFSSVRHLCLDLSRRTAKQGTGQAACNKGHSLTNTHPNSHRIILRPRHFHNLSFVHSWVLRAWHVLPPPTHLVVGRPRSHFLFRLGSPSARHPLPASFSLVFHVILTFKPLHLYHDSPSADSPPQISPCRFQQQQTICDGGISWAP